MTYSYTAESKIVTIYERSLAVVKKPVSLLRKIFQDADGSDGDVAHRRLTIKANL